MAFIFILRPVYGIMRIEIYKGMFPVLRQEKDKQVAMQRIRGVIADVTVKLSETELNNVPGSAAIPSLRSGQAWPH
jgi:hypothetical protein